MFPLKKIQVYKYTIFFKEFNIIILQNNHP